MLLNAVITEGAVVVDAVGKSCTAGSAEAVIETVAFVRRLVCTVVVVIHYGYTGTKGIIRTNGYLCQPIQTGSAFAATVYVPAARLLNSPLLWKGPRSGYRLSGSAGSGGGDGTIRLIGRRVGLRQVHGDGNTWGIV